MTSAIMVTVRPHWVSAWLLRPLGHPVVRVDGTEHAARWGRGCLVEVEPGEHVVAAGLRYRGSATLLGARDVHVRVGPDQTARLVARNGALNHQPFTLRPGPPAERR